MAFALQGLMPTQCGVQALLLRFDQALFHKQRLSLG